MGVLMSRTRNYALFIVGIALTSLMGTATAAVAAPPPASAAASVTPASCKQLGSTTLRPGSSGPAVRNLQDCLTRNGYPTNGVDGRFGFDTGQAAMAYQGDRGLGIDAVVGAASKRSLASSRYVTLPATCRPSDQLCVSKSRHTVYIHQPGQRLYALHTSTGNDQLYQNKQGQTVRATTPTGRFTVCRKVEGARASSSIENGFLFSPMYFDFAGDGRPCTGYALHGEPGANSVPAYNASHGCARIAMTFITRIFAWVRLGTPGSIVA